MRIQSTRIYICCSLSLGIWLLSNDSIEGNTAPFSSTCEEATFNNWLKRTLSELSPSDYMTLGFNYERLSAHSTRKGGTSYAASLPGLCSVKALFLRAGWSLGAVLPAYVHANEGSDQNAGRRLVGFESQHTAPNCPPYALDSKRPTFRRLTGRSLYIT